MTARASLRRILYYDNFIQQLYRNRGYYFDKEKKEECK